MLCGVHQFLGFRASIGTITVITSVWLAEALDDVMVHFVDVSEACGILPHSTPPGFVNGVAVVDFDQDGHVDIFVPTANGEPNHLYRNLGDGTFEEIAGLVGLDSMLPSRSALWLDINGNHRLDLLVAHDRGYGTYEQVRPYTLYKQLEDGTFVDITAASGLPLTPLTHFGLHNGGMAAADINNDGLLDLCLTQWIGGTRLFLNNGDGTFTDTTDSSHVGSGRITPWQPIMFDFNRDGLIDIFIAVDFHPNHLWMNQGDGTFLDIASEVGVDNPWNDMGVTLGDFDNDGLFDLYITDITGTSGSGEQRHSHLFHNRSKGGGLEFTDVALESGVAFAGWGWGATFLDADRDGWLDIAATNGNDRDEYRDDPSKFFRNTGDGFVDASDAVGFNDTYIGGALVSADLNRNGAPDLVYARMHHPILVLQNTWTGPARSGQPSWLTVQPRMSGGNRLAIGAVVRATVGDVTYSRPILAGTSCYGQEPAEALFGLGNADLVDELRIEWPDGRISTQHNIAVDQILLVEQDDALCTGDANADNIVNVLDLLAVISNWGSTHPSPVDVNGDGIVNVLDLLLVISNWDSNCGP